MSKKMLRIINTKHGFNKNLIQFSIAVMTAMSLTVAAPLMAADADAATAACDAADAARKSAAEVGMEWRDIKKSVEKAREMIESGDFEKAIKMCEQANFQGEAGVFQAEMEKKNWMSRVPK